MPNGSDPLVSVLMNCYNGGIYLRDAIESVLAQTYQHWEIVFWDNQSTDDSAKLFKSYPDTRLRYFRAPQHTNLGEGRVRAFQQLKGEFVAVLDVDDVWAPQKLEKQILRWQASEQAQKPMVLVGTWYRFIDQDSQEVGQLTPPSEMADICNAMVWGNPFVHSSVMFHKNTALQTGGYDESFIFANDFDLWLKLINLGEAAIVPEFLTDIRTHPARITRSPQHRLQLDYEALILYERAAKQFPLTAQTQHHNRKTLARHSLTYGTTLMQTGKFSQGWHWVCWGLRQDPLAGFRGALRPLKQLWQNGRT